MEQPAGPESSSKWMRHSASGTVSASGLCSRKPLTLQGSLDWFPVRLHLQCGETPIPIGAPGVSRVPYQQLAPGLRTNIEREHYFTTSSSAGNYCGFVLVCASRTSGLARRKGYPRSPCPITYNALAFDTAVKDGGAEIGLWRTNRWRGGKKGPNSLLPQYPCVPELGCRH